MKPSERCIVQVLLRDCGRTFAEELGIDLETGSASALFRLLCASLLFSTRISHSIALKAAGSIYVRAGIKRQQFRQPCSRLAGSALQKDAQLAGTR